MMCGWRDARTGRVRLDVPFARSLVHSLTCRLVFRPPAAGEAREVVVGDGDAVSRVQLRVSLVVLSLACVMVREVATVR